MRSALRIRQEGPRVLLIGSEGRTLLDLPWNAALEVAKQIIHCARLAEETAKAEKIAYDQAILLRSGFPVPLGLTNDEGIKREAEKLAAWDSRLRRYLPGGIKSGENVGTPTLIDHNLLGGILR